jgi:AcrR family transcriptional regulator
MADGHEQTDTAAGERRATVWERIYRPPKVARTTLSHAAIAAAAVEVADTEGLEAVSMRKLSGHLGVTTMALYRYVEGKEELFELMLDEAYKCYELPEHPDQTWRDVLRGHAYRTREVALRHPWTVEVAARGVVLLTPRLFTAVERTLAALDGLGIDIDTMYSAYFAVTSYARGAMADEVRLGQLMKSRQWSSHDDVREAYASHMQWLMGTGRYPVYRRYTQEARHKDDDLGRFEFGLECVLDGIAARLGI